MARLARAIASVGSIFSASRNASAASPGRDCSRSATPRLFARYASSLAPNGVAQTPTNETQRPQRTTQRPQRAKRLRGVRCFISVCTLRSSALPLRPLRGKALCDPLSLFDDDRAVGGNVRDRIDRAAGPRDFDLRGARGGAEAESEGELALRGVAGARLDDAPPLRGALGGGGYG